MDEETKRILDKAKVPYTFAYGEDSSHPQLVGGLETSIGILNIARRASRYQTNKKSNAA